MRWAKWWTHFHMSFIQSVKYGVTNGILVYTLQTRLYPFQTHISFLFYASGLKVKALTRAQRDAAYTFIWNHAAWVHLCLHTARLVQAGPDWIEPRIQIYNLGYISSRTFHSLSLDVNLLSAYRTHSCRFQQEPQISQSSHLGPKGQSSFRRRGVPLTNINKQ